MNHPRDEEIQAYLDGDATVDPAVAGHLRECPACRRVCEEYRTLYAALADDSQVYVPLPDAVRESAHDRKSSAGAPVAALADAVVAAWGAAMSLAAAVLVFVMVGGFGSGAGKLASDFGQSFRRGADMIVSLASSVAGTNGGPVLVMAAGLAVCVAHAVDRLLLVPLLAGVKPRP